MPTVSPAATAAVAVLRLLLELPDQPLQVELRGESHRPGPAKTDNQAIGFLQKSPDRPANR